MADAPAPDATSPDPGRDADQGGPEAGLEVLLVEDNAGERWLFSEILRSRGHRVTACETAEDAWTAYLEAPPDLIVLDLLLPGMDGMEFCRRVRRGEGGGRPIIVVVTGKKEPTVLEEVLAAGADDYVPKPVDVALLNIRLAVAEREVERQHLRYRTQAELNATSRELETLFRNLDDVFFSVDVEAGLLIQVSAGTADLLGRPRDDFAREPELWRTLLLPPEALARVRSGEIDPGASLVLPFQVPDELGGERWVEATLKPFHDADGRVTRVDGFVTDITDRQRAQAELAARNREIATLHRVSELTMALGRPDQVFGEVLEEVARATGYPLVLVERFDPDRDTLRTVHARGVALPPQGLVAPLHELPSGEAVRSRAPAIVRDLPRRGASLPAELAALEPVTWVAFPMVLDGVPLGALSLVHTEAVDVPRRLVRLGVSLANTLVTYLQRLDADEALRSSEARFRLLASQLQQANQELESFAYSISHDLRAPLRTMQGFAHTLLEDHGGGLEPRARDYARRIIESGRQAEHLISDLLAYSRLSFDEITLRRVALGRVVSEALGQLEADLAEAKADVRVEGELPEARGHHTILVQVMANLVANAAKFVSPGRAPRIRIRGRREQGRVRVEVEDNGVGIPDDRTERIFGVFERLSGPGDAPAREGTGIGLAIVRRGVERLGGRVGVDAAAEGGSVFWFELPA